MLLKQSNAAVALTGAGLSTRSGIPDFRSPVTGLWTRSEISEQDLLRSISIHAFGRDPEGFYQRLRPFILLILESEPNSAHMALADLEEQGYLKTVITQNGDMLHQRSGSQKVLEVHGSLSRATCIKCYCSVPGIPILERYLDDGITPRCQNCGGVLKPNIILPGEQLLRKVILAARQAAVKCDVMLIAGTSLPGGPVSQFPEIALRAGARLVVVNMMPTPIDSLADVVIQADVVEALPALAGRLRNE